ncbi:MAG: chromosome segregation protein ScpA, partial [Thermoflexia bacterium]
MLTASYPVRLPVFEGPLDLLLALIEQQQLDITAVSLAQVADQYLAVIEEMGRRTMADLTGFLVVAAKLLLIKSRVLLPDYRATDGEEDQDTAEFLHQLELYQFFRKVAQELERLEERGWRSYVRVGRTRDRQLPPNPHQYLEGVTLEDLVAAARAALRLLPPGPSVETVVASV